MLKQNIEKKIEIDLKNRPFQNILLNGESLARHFKFVNPTLKKRVAFGVSDLFNTLKNKEDHGKRVSADEIILKDAYPLYHEEDFDTTDETETSEEDDQKWHKWNVIDKGLILGVIPEPEMMEEIKSLMYKIQPPTSQASLHIYCITDDFEPGMGKKVQPIRHTSMGNEHYLMPMTDFGGGATTKEAVLAAVYQMRQTILKGDTVYIHCKAGRARSAMIVATYLAIYPPLDAPYHQYDLKGAISYLKNKRKQVNLHEKKVADDQWDLLYDHELHKIKGIGKLEKASQAIAFHKNLIERQKGLCEVKSNDFHENLTKVNNLANDLPIEAFNEASITNHPYMKHGDTILSSLEFKNYLLQVPSFKQLKLMATQAHAQGKRVDYVFEICETILNATNDDWFVNLCTDAKNPISQLFYNTKSTPEFNELIKLFLKDVAQYKKGQMIALNIQQTPEEIQLKELVNHMNIIQAYVKNLHKLSKKASAYEIVGQKRKLEQSWDIVCAKYESFKANASNPKRLKELLEALDELNIRLSNRITEEKKFINKHEDYRENLKDYSITICNFKMDLIKYHDSVNAESIRNLRCSNSIFANRNKDSSISSANTIELKKSNNKI